MNIEDYAKKHPKISGASLSPRILEKIQELPDGSRILDIGCAEGFTIERLAYQFEKEFEFVGVDLSETRIKSATEKEIHSAKFIVSSGESIPLEDNSFDCILCSQVLEHVESDEKLLKEIYRLLKPRGIFQVDTVFKKKWAWYFYKSPMGWALDPTHLREYEDLEEMRELFSKQHLKIELIEKKQAYRDLSKVSPIKLKLPIPGYYIVFVVGNK
jgi:ubiquinone/menaquinone biosynthesis C-methylase UbiE